MNKYFDFEKSIEEIDERIKLLENNDSSNLKTIEDYKNKRTKLLEKIYTKLTPWQKVQIARHPERPHAVDYINNIFQDFVILAGDRKFADDQAVVGGLAKIDNNSVVVIGTEKGNSVESRLKHNFGMVKPEGYRKVQRLYLLAEKFNLPIVTLIDTAGAFPGKEAEERGQAESIASTIATSLKIKTPIIAVIIGEGGSGGAIALATADIVMMLENSIYSVISPEGCASILWRDPTKSLEAAKAMKLTATELLKIGIIDEVVEEPLGGAHRNKQEMASLVEVVLKKYLNEFENSSGEEILEQRKKKFLNIGKQKSFTVFSENENNLFNKYNLLTLVKRNLLKYKNGLVITILLFLLVVFFLN